MPEYMFDADIFPQIIEKHAPALKACMKKHRYFVTPERRNTAGNNPLFTSLEPAADDKESIALTLSLLEKKAGSPQNEQNALIIAVCQKNGYTFVTEDPFRADIAWKYGTRVNNLYEFVKALRIT